MKFNWHFCQKKATFLYLSDQILALKPTDCLQDAALFHFLCKMQTHCLSDPVYTLLKVPILIPLKLYSKQPCHETQAVTCLFFLFLSMSTRVSKIKEVAQRCSLPNIQTCRLRWDIAGGDRTHLDLDSAFRRRFLVQSLHCKSPTSCW